MQILFQYYLHILIVFEYLNIQVGFEYRYRILKYKRIH